LAVGGKEAPHGAVVDVEGGGDGADLFPVCVALQDRFDEFGAFLGDLVLDEGDGCSSVYVAGLGCAGAVFVGLGVDVEWRRWVGVTEFAEAIAAASLSGGTCGAPDSASRAMVAWAMVTSTARGHSHASWARIPERIAKSRSASKDSTNAHTASSMVIASSPLLGRTGDIGQRELNLLWQLRKDGAVERASKRSRYGLHQRSPSHWVFCGRIT
jgi:hypothetical protein